MRKNRLVAEIITVGFEANNPHWTNPKTVTQMPDSHLVQDKILNMKVRSPPSLFFLIFQGSVLFVSFAKTTSGLWILRSVGHKGVPPKAFLHNLPNITKLLTFVKFPMMILKRYWSRIFFYIRAWIWTIRVTGYVPFSPFFQWYLEPQYFYSGLYALFVDLAPSLRLIKSQDPPVIAASPWKPFWNVQSHICGLAFWWNIFASHTLENSQSRRRLCKADKQNRALKDLEEQ